MSKHNRKSTQKLQQPKPKVDPRDVFSPDECKAVIRFVQRKVKITGVVGMENPDDDLRTVITMTQVAKRIEQLAEEELQKLTGGKPQKPAAAPAPAPAIAPAAEPAAPPEAQPGQLPQTTETQGVEQVETVPFWKRLFRLAS